MSAKLVTNIGQLKLGQRVVEVWATGYAISTVVKAPVEAYKAAVINGRLYAFVAGPCKHCREGAGLVRGADGEHRSCRVCFGGYL